MDYIHISPVIFSIFGFSVKWYSVPYIMGYISFIYTLRKVNEKKKFCSKAEVDKIPDIALIGLIIGARVFYLYFYDLTDFSFLRIFKIYEGGMSFHGGAIGFILSIFLYCRHRKINMSFPLDAGALCIPVAIFFGRIANYVNGELYGRPTNSIFGTIFPSDPEGLIRHPSQIYESLTEGLLLFVIIMLARKKMEDKPYMTFHVCLGLYCFFRFFMEMFREPDSQLGYIFMSLTMGQILSVAILIVNIIIAKKTVILNKQHDK